MSFGEFLSQFLGWLGNFVAWVFNWCPQRVLIEWTEGGIHYPKGDKPRVLAAGVHWYVPNRGRIVQHNCMRFTLEIEPMALTTRDQKKCAIGMTVTMAICDIYRYEVENFQSEDNMRERAKNALRGIVAEFDWAELCKPAAEGSRLEQKLTNRMSTALESFGVEVEYTSPTDQVLLGGGAYRLFGVNVNVDSNKV